MRDYVCVCVHVCVRVYRRLTGLFNIYKSRGILTLVDRDMLSGKLIFIRIQRRHSRDVLSRDIDIIAACISAFVECFIRDVDI